MAGKKRSAAPKSAYDELVARGLIHTRKGEDVMSAEERLERRRAQTRQSMEARRRATQVLIHSHKDEFDDLYRAEKEALQEDPGYTVPQR